MLNCSTMHAPHSVAEVSDLGRNDDARMKTLRVRSGFTLLECLVAAAMLGIVLALAAQLFVWDARERREVWRRQVAQQEAASLLERLSVTPYDELTSERLQTLTLTPESQGWLHDGKLAITTEEFATPRTGKRLRVEIRWGEANANAPVRLTGWRFAPEAMP